MEYRSLGRSGLLVSEIAYGNWLTHGSQVEEETALACVHAALDAGITTFDTADAYAGTRAESVLGRALHGQRRDGLEILTKVYFPTGPGRNDRGLSRKHILLSIDKSLRRLGTSYVDVYQAHRFDHTTELVETMEAFADVVRAGKALYLGVSEWTAEQIRAAHALARELHVPLVANQPEYSALWRVMEAQVAPACRELGMGQLVWSPVAQGVLAGKYRPGEPAPADSRGADEKGGGTSSIRGYVRAEVLERVARLRPLAAEAGLSMAQLALAWVLRNPDVSAAIIGASRPEQVAENTAASGVVLEPELVARMDELLAPVAECDPRLTEKSSPRSRP
ncbi:aldo/keto reductase [Streptomyces tateyamensis]|uniref:Aldo/keto reductase n=1 Tax=Streptomyces tateyamensis TaxID=565073 RepID=A0A2V4NMP2_9ACTN|nr:aldo/keto reductase family protein [Streptomyces tateyamensis]PYC87402.1 aldo/keto reductase [Streptomyces tateyamensis]